MIIEDSRTYYNCIYKAIVVNSAIADDPAGKSRVQIYIPNIQGTYESIYTDYMNSSNKSTHSDRFKYPWAFSLVEDLQNGNVVYCGNIENNLGSYIIFGLEAHNPANVGIGQDDGGLGFTNGLDLLSLCMPIILFNEVSLPLNCWPDNIPDANYGYINPKDNGGWSIGIIQWHHTRAFDLLNYIASQDGSWLDRFPDTSIDLVSDLKASLIANSTNSYRNKYQENFQPTPETDTYKGIYNMLTSDIGKQSQREYASKDTQNAITYMQSKDITNPAIIIYLADIMNQYGNSLPDTIDMAARISSNSSTMMEQLEQFREWVKNNFATYNDYATRRDTTYEYILDLEKQGKLQVANLVSMGEILDSPYVPEYGEYIWPTPCDTINCFYGSNAEEQATADKGIYKWNNILHGTYHYGVDFAPLKNGVDGDPVVAVGNGKVVSITTGGVEHRGSDFSTVQGPSQGNAIAIQMDNNSRYNFVYMHLCKEPTLKIGDHVNAGDIVGYMGSTGSSSGTHLHLGLHLDDPWCTKESGKRIDPLPKLGKRAKN